MKTNVMPTSTLPPRPMPASHPNRLSPDCGESKTDALLRDLAILVSTSMRAPVGFLASGIDQPWIYSSRDLTSALLHQAVDFVTETLKAQRLLLKRTDHHSLERESALTPRQRAPLCFFAGIPVLGQAGSPIGVIGIADPSAHRSFSATDYEALLGFSVFAGHLLDTRSLQAIEHEQESLGRLRAASVVSSDGICEVDCTSGLTSYSACWQQMMGLPALEASGPLQLWTDRIHPSDAERVGSAWGMLLTGEDSHLEVSYRCRHENSSWLRLSTRAVSQRNRIGAVTRIIASINDVTAGNILDSLTGLHNRTSLLQHLQSRIDQGNDRFRNYAVLFIDVDFFKRINDSLGYSRGNAVLIELATRLELTVQDAKESLVCRLGGDEFVVMVSDVASENDVVTYAALLKHILEWPIACNGQQVYISASIGVAFGAPGTYTQAEAVLEDADVAMYRAKQNGKAQSAVFSQNMRVAARHRLEIETDLRLALQGNQFALHYQPKVQIDGGQVLGFEALIRWFHPERGMISPGEFIPIAEETGLITSVGRWAAVEAIRQLAAWRKAGVVDQRVTMAVNISTRQFREHDLLEWFLGILRQADLPPEALVLEITESVLVEDAPAARNLLEQIVAVGIGLDLDDFGTGYSSLSYLHRFPFRSVKIDQSFVSRLSTDPESMKVLASIIALAGSLNMAVIAEGVETPEQAASLFAMGCFSAQGYLFSPPRSAVDLELLLRSGLNIAR